MPFKYYAINKPYNVLSQFTSDGSSLCLKDFFNFSKNVYPIGRLDKDSEGLLLLSNDKTLTEKLMNPKTKIQKEYYALVERIPDSEAIKKLQSGVLIEGKKTLPAKVRIIDPPDVWERSTPIRFRKNVPECWLSITITEGRNRQIRKMCASVGHPVLRLIRFRINNVLLNKLLPGEYKELDLSNIL